jgi:hypothetical protein
VTPEVYWTKMAAIGEWVGAAATFTAVLVSLYLATYGRRARLSLRVSVMYLFAGGQQSPPMLTFAVTNRGERPVYVQSVGWRTGWLRRGPQFLRAQLALQSTGTGHGLDPPYQIEPGSQASSHTWLSAVLEQCAERTEDPFFSRDWPVLGRRSTRVRAYVHTADGYTIRCKPDGDLVSRLVAAEVQASALAGTEGPDG